MAGRAEAQSHGIPGRPGRMALAGALGRLLTPQFCGLVRQELADAEPGNTTYRRDLSISFERLADLAMRQGAGQEADQWASRALQIRRQLVREEPGRLDFAVELAYVLYLSASIGESSDAGPALAREARSLLEPFEQLGYVTPRALDLLAWARQEP